MGNAGYQDVLGSHYIWDQTVPNHANVKKGDLALLRDGDYVLGIGWIDEILPSSRDKDRFRCPNPNCRKTGLKTRTTLQPKYRCFSCGSVFDVPDVEHLKGINFYRADYARTWQPLDTSMPITAISPAYLKNATQHAIRELDLAIVRAKISASQFLGDPWWLLNREKETELPSGHIAVIGKARIGQQRFREEMLSRFDSCCAISGPQHPAMLEAAHLYRYASRPQHHLDGGLLLRRDIHALFDRRLLLIDPDSDWRVRLAPDLHSYPQIWRYDGIEMSAKPDVRPNALYLREHAAIARAGW